MSSGATSAIATVLAQHETSLVDLELMDKDETCRFFGGQMRPINHATLYRGIKTRRYPAPIKVGMNSSRWIKSECVEALQQIIAERDSKAVA